MFYADFTALNPQEQTVWLAEVKDSLSDTTMSKNESDITVGFTTLPFYKDFKLYAISDNSKPEPNTWYMLYKPGHPFLMDWTNMPIYEVNELAPIKLDKTTAAVYARFFFHFVRGQLGRFIIVEKPEEIRWLPEAEQEEKDASKEYVKPLAYNGITRDNFITLRASVIFKNALFQTDIKIALFDTDAVNPDTKETEHFSIGQMKLVNETLLLEDINVVVDDPPTEFG